jgi:uncharacterized spore protein YtfJ
MEQFNMTDNMNSLLKGLEDFTQHEGVIGKPVMQGDKTFLPVISLTMGYGGGNASMKGQNGNAANSGTGMSSSGSGAMGIGAKLCTDAVILINGQDVSVIPMNASCSSTNLVDKIPQIISGLKQGQGQNQGQGQSQGQNQGQAGGQA